jgi:hypothetical protein
MISKYFFAVFAVAVLVASATVTTSAQVAELRGHVYMQQADGQKVPLADAVIDVFRTDLTRSTTPKRIRKASSYLRSAFYRNIHSSREPSNCRAELCAWL